MATLYGARLWQNESGNHNLRYDYLGDNSEVFAQNDIVGVSGGKLIVATQTLVGVVVKTQTLTSTNTTVAKVYPGFIPITNDSVWLMGTDSDLTDNATDGAHFYGITGGTGAQQVAVSDGAFIRTAGATFLTRAVVGIVKVDPRNLGGSGAGSGLRECLVRFVFNAHSPINLDPDIS